MTEEWRPVVGHEGYFEVSSLGRVRSLERVVKWDGGQRLVPGRIRKTPLSDGYPQVSLVVEGVQRVTKVHRLVAAAFLGPRPEGMEVRHLDGDSTNSAAANLAHGTHSENSLDQVRHGTHPHASRTHCKRGHEFTSVNTVAHLDGRRECRECRNAGRRRLRAARREGQSSERR